MAEDKDKLRKKIKKNIASCSPMLLDYNSLDVADRMFFLKEFKKSKVVMVFISILGEVNTSYIIKNCFEQGKTVVVPKVKQKKGVMDAVKLEGKKHPLEPSSYGILEPVEAKKFPVEKIDLIIVPGLAFDEKLNRLGRGGGYYDKFLAQKGCTAKKCGVAYEMQIVDKLPVKEHDQKMDIIITEDRVIR